MDLYVDITGVRHAAEAFLAQSSPDRAATYATDTEPFLEPFDSLIVVANAPVNGQMTSKGALLFK